jgi:hypothetical protein|tara:strand:+ start:3017 stop:3286 length:270 start_codon:yes stop_codon:yes gene_type:complete
MNKIEKLIQIKEIEISEMSTAIDRMNARATAETAMTVAVANDVFGGTLRELKGQLFDLKEEQSRIEKQNELNRIMGEMGDEIVANNGRF